MGLNKINVEEKINNKYRRQNSFYKRKFGILRKLIQMSKLCETDMLVYIYEKDLRQLYEYKTNDKFNYETIKSICHTVPQKLEYLQLKSYSDEFPTVKLTHYTDSDYEVLTRKHLPKAQAEKELNELKEEVDKL